MERFTQIPRITTGILKKTNTVQIYLHIFTIADLVNPEGTTVPEGMLNGDWQAGSNLLWPQIPCPSKPNWEIFRKCIRATFCTLAPQYQPSHFSVSLDKQLGSCYLVPRNAWYQCYKLRCNLYLRQIEGTTTTELLPSKTKGYYHSTGTVQKIPLDSQLIAYQQVEKNVWTQRPINLSLSTSSKNPPPGHLIGNTLTNPTTERLIVGSNGFLHLQDQVAAAAWIISAGPKWFMSATFIMENVSSYTSHRIELEGIFRVLHHLDFLNMTPTMADQWCNNKKVVKDTTRPIKDPSGMLKPKQTLY